MIKTGPDAKFEARKSLTGTPEETRTEYKPVAKSALKKATNGYQGHLKKEAKKIEQAAKEAESSAAREAQFEAARAVVIVEDASKPVANKIKIRDTTANRNTRVQISGWVHRLRLQKNMAFVTLRDGSGLLQCILADVLTTSYDIMTLTPETTLTLYGEIKEVPAGAHAPGGHELIVDYFKIIGKAPGGDEVIGNIVAPDADPQTKYNYRHLTIRGDIASATLKVRAAVVKAFRKSYEDLRLLEVTTPCMVQTQVEGGSTLFSFDYYGEKVCSRVSCVSDAVAQPVSNCTFVAGLPHPVVAAVPRNLPSFPRRRLLHPGIFPRREVAHQTPSERVHSH